MIAAWFCPRHPQAMLIRRSGRNAYSYKSALLQRDYCPQCGREQTAAFKIAAIEEGERNEARFNRLERQAARARS